MGFHKDLNQYFNIFSSFLTISHLLSHEIPHFIKTEVLQKVPDVSILLLFSLIYSTLPLYSFLYFLWYVMWLTWYLKRGKNKLAMFSSFLPLFFLRVTFLKKVHGPCCPRPTQFSATLPGQITLLKSWDPDLRLRRSPTKLLVPVLRLRCSPTKLLVPG